MVVVTNVGMKSVDIVIITVREDEHRAVLTRIPGSVDSGRTNRTYSRATLPRQQGGTLSVAVVKTAEQGNSAARSTAQDAIEDLHPRWIFLVGIAGALPEPEIALGDVILANRLHAFTIGAATEGGLEFADQGAQMPRSVENLVAGLVAFEPLLGGWETEDSIRVPRPRVDKKRVYGPTSWRKKVRDALTVSAPRTVPQAHGRPVATTPFVVKNAELTAGWRASARDVAAVEMELEGVYAAARRADCPVLMIRGISDIVGLARDPAWTTYACNAAASFCLALLHNVPASYLPLGQQRRDGSRGVASRTNRAWAVLDTEAGRSQFRSDISGKVSQIVIEDGEPASVTDDEGASLAMSPDGSLLAIMIGRTLRISTVGHSGTVRPWEDFDFDPDEEMPEVRVRAVARKGDLEVWCAVAYGDRTRFASLSRSMRPVWHEAKNPKAAQYAAFYGSRLVLVTVDRSDSGHARCKCWQVPLRPGADAAEWAPIGRDPRTVTAIDAARVGRRTYLCLLAGVADGREGETTGTDLLVLSAGSTDLLVERLDSVYEHVSVVRHPEGDPETLCVLLAKRGEDRAWESRMLQRPGAAT